MADLLRKPKGISGNVHHITPANAKGQQSLDWAYVGFALYHLELGEGISKLTGTNEVIVVLVEGKAEINAAGIDFGEMGDRMDVFERTPEDVFNGTGPINGKTVEGKWTRALLTPSTRSLLDELIEAKVARRFDDIAQVDVGIVTGANNPRRLKKETASMRSIS